MDGEGDEESVVVEAVMGNLQLFSKLLAKPQLSSRKQNVVGGVMWVPDSQQCHWSSDTVDGGMEAYVDGVSVHGSPKE
jgi:hypothetical protein